ncbi:MAG: DUF4389 domain-containing protein [Arthrobacter sp.]|uniref:DUF4389 domain-containing protein n=1 Tax=Arthrobacter sp. TaxID=1667 RepID=UPI00346B8029
MKFGRIIMLVAGTLMALAGCGLLAVAAGLGWANAQQQDGRFLTSPVERFRVASHALTTPGLDVMVEDGMPAGFPSDGLGSILLRGAAPFEGQEIFLGVAPRDDAAAYLAGVAHTELTGVEYAPFRATYRDVAGTRTPQPPTGEEFWAAAATGPGTQELVWDIRPGEWAVVVMRADGEILAAADLQVGARSDLLGPLAAGLLGGGIALLLIGGGLIVLGAIGLGRHSRPPGATTAPVAAGAAPVAAAAVVPDDYRPYPARLTGHLDPALSNWKWLVKWFLSIPHLVVLAFLWVALIVTTIVTWFAILFTGRYPRSLFNFNVGVLRWHWRVVYYAFSPLGTDRYPPFTLERTDYPADAEVEYPLRLHRGLVLVKSWLLAIPHLLVVAALTGSSTGGGSVDREPVPGSGSSAWDAGAWEYESTAGVSLLGVLVLVAAVILLFTGRYRRPLFDLIMGLNRWIFRVGVYVLLMRDEYPPFRLDQGPAEPHAPPVSAPAPESAPPGA